jgi:anti-sigma regulatory factor (Ser/Thr protein kinase)
VVIAAVDEGPGIPDIELAMQEGFSTAPDYVREMGFGAGMGLPNMRKCADDLKVDSEVGKGTSVRAVIRNCRGEGRTG